MDNSKLEEIVAFLAEYQWIYKNSNTKFVKAGVLDDFPPNWFKSLMNLSHNELNNIPFGMIPDTLDEELKEFLMRISRLSIKVSSKEFPKSSKTMRGVNPKKFQEISNLSRQIHDICREKNIQYLVDLGSGLGYLCQMLYEKFNYRILGIECDEERVKTAEERQEKFFPTSKGSVKFVSHFVTSSSWDFISQELNKVFGIDVKDTSVAVVGLHACGDLTVTALKLFQGTEVIRAAIVMPCCYHKMAIDSQGRPVNFPLSGRLTEAMKGASGIACRPFLRLACQQAVSRWRRMTQEEHRVHGRNMFQRALLDAVVTEDQEIQRVKGGERVDGEDFDGAICGFEIRECRTNALIPWKNEHKSKWRSLCDKYPRGDEISECLTLLQTTIQELCENVILMDRKIYVEETSEAFHCEIMKILDADTSPRCVVLMAMKS
ncbi:methyltransferase-like protein 25B [Phlebotomus argentipes]|uniref:methyltransferase-like protein 25B n=1 Tax=Phlebotomus argentipes TaxID=94469 RepID=UPI002892CA72|nr:methyltransferase-like protein 25B [Phlebotomus argentipes]XP_059615955.1 methyltransferase-like protein 25B [Phlebotomus argentipes]